MDYLLVFANFLKNIFLKLINILSFIKIINKKKKNSLILIIIIINFNKKEIILCIDWKKIIKEFQFFLFKSIEVIIFIN